MSSSDKNDLFAFFDANKARMREQLFELLRIPSISNDVDKKGEIKRCAEWLVDHFKSIGLTQTKLYETPGHPIVYSELIRDPSLPTYLLYGHYDVQPADPLELWNSPPFEPELRDNKIYARGATDDKGQFFCHIKGIETHLAVNKELPVNLKIIIEGEEEVGSASLEPWVREHADMLACDAVIVSDSSMYGPGQPSICYGLRGLAYFEIEVTGPDHDLHSGLFGGSIENPINACATILSKLKNEDGVITIPGFYDNVRDLTEKEREAYSKLTFDKDEFIAKTGSKNLHGEVGCTTLEHIWSRPTLDCNGIIGGFTGDGAKTVLPSVVKAKFSCRLVPDQTCEEIEKKVIDYIREIAPDTVSVKVSLHHGGDPVLIEQDHPAIVAASRALEKSWNTTPVFTREGGSIPVVATFLDALHVPTVLIGLGYTDDCLHSPNEKFNIECFEGGIRTSLYLWSELANV